MVSRQQQAVTRAVTAALAVALALGAAACTRPLVPASATADNPVPHQSAVLKVHKPLLGADLYATDNYRPAIVRRDGKRDLTYMRHILKLDAVGIAWNLYTARDHSNVVSRASQSLSPANVATLTRQAKADGFSIEFRPLIKVDAGSVWEGYITPENDARWFNSFFHAELPYLRIAQRYHISEFVIGTELHFLNDLPNYEALWNGFVKRVHTVYKGIVSYATYGADYFPPSGPRLISSLKEYGMTGYPDLHLGANATQAQVESRWLDVFYHIPKKTLERTAIDEIGIPALAQGYDKPAIWAATGTPIPRVQAQFFTGACRAVAAFHMRGIYFWNVNLADYPYRPSPSPVTFEDKAGARAIAACAKVFNSEPN
jgi:hypothetical protein